MGVSPPPRHSVHEIMTGVEAIMSRLSGGRAVDRALANSIAGKIHLAVNDPVLPMEVLAGNPAFETLVTAAAPSLAKTMDDPAIQLAAARAEVERYNPSGGPLSPAAVAALGPNTLGHIGANAPRGGSAGEAALSTSASSTGASGYAALSSRWEPSSGGAGLTPANFASTPFAGMGLDYNTTKTLFSQGFNQKQIERAANDSRAIGLSPKAAAIDAAHLRKAEGKRTDRHVKTLADYGREREELERERLKEEGKPDSPEKTENLRRIEERRKALEGRADKYERDQVQTPEGKKRFHRLREMVRDQADLRAKIGDPKARAEDKHDREKLRTEKGHQAAAEAVKKENFKVVQSDSDTDSAKKWDAALGLQTNANKHAAGQSSSNPITDAKKSEKSEPSSPTKTKIAKSNKSSPIPV